MHRRASSSNIFSTFSRARRERQLQTAASGPDEERGRRSGRPPSHRAHAGATRGRQDPNYDSWSPSQHALLSASCVECFLFVSVSFYLFIRRSEASSPGALNPFPHNKGENNRRHKGTFNFVSTFLFLLIPFPRSVSPSSFSSSLLPLLFLLFLLTPTSSSQILIQQTPKIPPNLR